MTDEIRNSHPTDQTDAELTTADLAGASQKTPRGLNESGIETESQPVGSPRAAAATDRSRPGTQGTATAPALDQEAAPLFSSSEANDLRARPAQDHDRSRPDRAGEGQWDQGENVSTEDLRLGLRRYRSFFSRLLSL